MCERETNRAWWRRPCAEHLRMDTFKAGEMVGAKRWPFAGGHPSCWGKPWRGEVLRREDRRAWEGALRCEASAGSGQTLKQSESAQDLMQGMVPVLWRFDAPRVYWERVECLRTYEEDLREWREVRTRAEDAEAARGVAKGVEMGGAR